MEKVSSQSKQSAQVKSSDKSEPKKTETKKGEGSFEKLLFGKKSSDTMIKDQEMNKPRVEREVLFEIDEEEKKSKDMKFEDLEGFTVPRTISDKGSSSEIGLDSLKPADTKVKLDENLINKIVESSRIVKKGDITSMEISVKSEVFDNLKMIITSEAGGIKTEFITDNPNLREMIKESSQDLERSLINRGLEVLNIVVRDKTDEQKSDSQSRYDEYRRMNDR